MPRSRPVVLLGEGARGADIHRILSWGIPILTSWQAKDLLDNDHPLYFGSPGIYGQRCANKVLHNADFILALGNRMAIWNVGYQGLRPDQELLVVDIDPAEALKYPNASGCVMEVSEFITDWGSPKVSLGWWEQCAKWAGEYPIDVPEQGTHDDTNYINSYRFVHALQTYFTPDEVIVTDMGAALCSAFQMLSIKPPQRLLTSGGLGEMGCGLPAAIGASFARNKGRVVCLNTDGGMMLNLQELATIAHHHLPIKIIVFNNSGYGMIRETQARSGMLLSGVDERTGISFPNFRHLALSFGITGSEIRSWQDFDRIIPAVMNRRDEGPDLVDYIMDPSQKLVPKLGYDFIDGKQVYSRFDEMSPKAQTDV